MNEIRTRARNRNVLLYYMAQSSSVLSCFCSLPYCGHLNCYYQMYLSYTILYVFWKQIKHNSTTERLSCEVGELSKIKRELLEVIEHKRLELEEKNSSIKTYLNKVVSYLIPIFSRNLFQENVNQISAETLGSTFLLDHIFSGLLKCDRIC